MIKVEHINPFIAATQTVMRDFCHVEAKIGKPYLSQANYEGVSIMIIVGITGDLRGQVLINMSTDIACDITSHIMMGMPVPELSDMARSAISELGNMIMGNTATIFSTKGIVIDITPPTVGNGTMSFTTNYASNICIPLEYEEGKKIEINIAIKGD